MPIEAGVAVAGSDADPRGVARLPLPAPSGASSSSGVVAKAGAASHASAAPKAGAFKAPAPKAAASPGSPSSPDSFTVGGSTVGASGSLTITPAKAKAAAKGVVKGRAKATSRRALKKRELAVPAIGGGDVLYELYKAPLRVEPYGNWTMYCPHHDDCERTCGVVPRNTKKLKCDLEPLAFLHAWRDCEVDPEKGHRKSPVKDEAVRKFYNEHKDELMALRDMFYTP